MISMLLLGSQMICRYLGGKNECHAHNYYIYFIEMFSPVLVPWDFFFVFGYHCDVHSRTVVLLESPVGILMAFIFIKWHRCRGKIVIRALELVTRLDPDALAMSHRRPVGSRRVA